MLGALSSHREVNLDRVCGLVLRQGKGLAYSPEREWEERTWGGGLGVLLLTFSNNLKRLPWDFSTPFSSPGRIEKAEEGPRHRNT